jgi:hypothetical protein
MKTLAFVLSLEKKEEFELIDIGGEAIKGEEFFGDSKSHWATLAILKYNVSQLPWL